MPNHPWTTITGWLLVAAAGASFAHTLLVGGDIASAREELVAALAGVGLIKAADAR